jgi:hypothetical protein
MPDLTKQPRRFPPPWTVEETQPCFIVAMLISRRSRSSIARMSRGDGHPEIGIEACG